MSYELVRGDGLRFDFRWYDLPAAWVCKTIFNQRPGMPKWAIRRVR